MCVKNDGKDIFATAKLFEPTPFYEYGLIDTNTVTVEQRSRGCGAEDATKQGRQPV